MIQLGVIQTLQIVKKVEFGVYLGDGTNPEEKVLLPKNRCLRGHRPVIR